MRTTVFFVLMIIFMVACKNNTVTSPGTDTISNRSGNLSDVTPDTKDHVETSSLSNGRHCFAYTKDKDSIFLFLELKDSMATGELQYRLYEKDANTGTVKGAFHGDTLFAGYTFLSEGIRSLREVAFLRKGNILQEGTGNMKDNGNGLVFINHHDLTFNGNSILRSVDCDPKDKQ